MKYGNTEAVHVLRQAVELEVIRNSLSLYADVRWGMITGNPITSCVKASTIRRNIKVEIYGKSM